MEWTTVFNPRLLKSVSLVACCTYFLWTNGKDLWMMVKHGRCGFIYYSVFWIFFINLWLLLVCDWLFSRVTALWFWNRDNNRIWNLYSEAIIKASFFRLHTLYMFCQCWRRQMLIGGIWLKMLKGETWFIRWPIRGNSSQLWLRLFSRSDTLSINYINAYL